MKALRPVTLALLLAWLPVVAAAQTTLLVLQDTADPQTRLELGAEAGAERVEPVAAAAIWRLAPGDPVAQAARPAERVVELYTGTPRALDLLARVVVRYYRSPRGWAPHFRLDEQPVVARVNGRWQPLLLPGGAGPLVRFGNALPNAEGFFPVLEFGPAAGRLAIVAWRIH